MEPASELHVIEAWRVSCVKGSRENDSIWELLIRVVPPKSFGPFTGIRRAFLFSFDPAQDQFSKTDHIKKGEKNDGKEIS